MTTKFDAVQTRNGRAVLTTVASFARQHGWDPHRTFRVAHMCIMCVITESSMRVLANKNVGCSWCYPHDGFGSDHASVGLFQQQVPMWGTAWECMNVDSSTRKFLNSLDHKGLTPFTLNPPVPNWMRIQRVQVSAYADGSNYERNVDAGLDFLRANWNYHTMGLR